MKATINESGRMTITAETPLESYALTKWVGENWNPELNTIDSKNVIIKRLPLPTPSNAGAG